MKSALLVWVAELMSLGFTINPYDPCVANKIVDGHQSTVCWHVDDLLIGHAKPETVTWFLTWIAKRYNTPDKKLTPTWGSYHDYLGINIDFSYPGRVKFDMVPCINKIIDAFPEKITGVTSTPAADHLFAVCPSAEAHLLPKDQAQGFHHTTAQLLFLSRVCCDIQTPVSFLTTRVKHPDGDDWGKLKRVLTYLHSTCSLKLTLFAELLSIIWWYADASHQTHKDYHGHTGAILTLGHGAVSSSSTKQKLNTKGSTKTKIVGLFDETSDILWTCNFYEAQGYYTITANNVYQDNMSTLLLAKNGHILSSKCTKHIKAKYFFIKHYHHSGEIDLQYCPTDDMWADILTKPLQGPKVWVMQAFLMNCSVNFSEDSVLTKTVVKQPLPVNIGWSPHSLRPPLHHWSVLRQNTLVLRYHVSIVGWFLYSQIPGRRKWHGKTAPFHVTNLIPPLSLLEFGPQQSREFWLIILVIISNSNINLAHAIELF